MQNKNQKKIVQQDKKTKIKKEEISEGRRLYEDMRDLGGDPFDMGFCYLGEGVSICSDGTFSDEW